MVAPIARGDTTQWRVVEWVYQQAQHLDPTAHAVLVFLSTHAFYRAKNPENGEVSQVLYQHSTEEAIAGATALTVRTVRRALLRLQEKAFIQREYRERVGPHAEPMRIYVLWTEDWDFGRSKFRGGERIPDLGPTRNPKPELRLVHSTSTGL